MDFLNSPGIIGTGVKVSFTFKGQPYRGTFLSKDVQKMADIFQHEDGMLEDLPWANESEVKDFVVERQ